MAQICPNCQATNDDTVTFCFRCGTRLGGPAETIVADLGQPAETKSNTLIYVLGGIAIFLCIAAVAVGAYFLLREDQAQPEPTATALPAQPPVVTVAPTQAPTLQPIVEPTQAPPSSTPEPTVEVATNTPEPTPTATDTPFPTPNQYGLRVGIQVRVFTTEGDQLRMRQGPAVGNPVVVGLTNGTLLDIIGGPQTDAGGLTWWEVRTSDGKTGWCVEFIDGIQTLVP